MADDDDPSWINDWITNSQTDWADLMAQVNEMIWAANSDDYSGEEEPEEMKKLDKLVDALDDGQEIVDNGQTDGDELTQIIPNAVFAFVYLATLVLVQFHCKGIIHHAYTTKAIVLMISCTFRAGSAGTNRLDSE